MKIYLFDFFIQTDKLVYKLKFGKNLPSITLGDKKAPILSIFDFWQSQRILLNIYIKYFLAFFMLYWTKNISIYSLKFNFQNYYSVISRFSSYFRFMTEWPFFIRQRWIWHLDPSRKGISKVSNFVEGGWMWICDSRIK